MIRRPFYLAETETTVAQFRRFVEATSYVTDAERGTDDGQHHGVGSFAAMPAGDREWLAAAAWRNPFPNLPEQRLREEYPVVHVSWNDARAFCDRYRLSLPSEAQWEYACRAGASTTYPWGDDPAGGQGYLNGPDLAAKRRFTNPNDVFPFDDGAPVLAAAGAYKPNAWGLRDMLGSLEEWCQDTYVSDASGGAAELEESAREVAGVSGRVLRGAGWTGAASNARPAFRAAMTPASRRDFIGFRVAVDAERVR